MNHPGQAEQIVDCPNRIDWLKVTDKVTSRVRKSSQARVVEAVMAPD
jgi:hypothetical protein